MRLPACSTSVTLAYVFGPLFWQRTVLPFSTCQSFETTTGTAKLLLKLRWYSAGILISF